MYTFDVPVNGGAESCVHLMSSESLVSDNLALVDALLLPSGLFRLL